MDLRPYQVQAINEAREHILAGRKSVLVVLPTGSGKTRCAAEFVTRHLSGDPSRRVLWLAHRAELIDQAATRIHRDGIAERDIRRIVGGKSLGYPDARVTVASIQTLVARNLTPASTLVVFDEAHHFVAREYGRIASAYGDAIRIGLTATPERADWTPLGDLFNAMVAPISVAELTTMGVLVPCDVIAPDYQDRSLAESPVEAYQKFTPQGRAVVFCQTVDHARQVATEFTAAGLSAAAVDGGTRSDVRARMLDDFQHGRVRVLVNCMVLTEGWDAPCADTCILARGVGSVSMYLQTVGRVLRSFPGKDKATLIDLRGAVHQWGMPDDEREYSLEGRGISSKKEKVEPITKCNNCGAVFRYGPTSCPRCGFAIAKRATQIEIDGRGVKKMERAQVYSCTQKRDYFDAMCRNARTHGYKPGWIAHRFKAKFGHWPEWPITVGGG